MWATGDAGRPVSARSFLDEDREAEAVAAWCAARLRAGTPAAEVGVLFRVRRLAGPLSAALTAAGLPHRVLGDRALLERAEIRDALAHLQLLANPRDRQALVRAAADAAGRRAAGGRARPRARRPRHGRRPAARRAPGRRHRRPHRGRPSDAHGVGDGRAARSARTPTRRCTGSSGAGSWRPACPLASRARPTRRRPLASSACAASWRWPAPTPPATPTRRWSTSSGRSRSPPNPRTEAAERITLATIHAAKGLEWDAVWVCGWEEDTLPAALALADGERGRGAPARLRRHDPRPPRARRLAGVAARRAPRPAAEPLPRRAAARTDRGGRGRSRPPAEPPRCAIVQHAARDRAAGPARA